MRLTGSPEATGEGFSSRVISLHWEYCPLRTYDLPVGEVWDAARPKRRVCVNAPDRLTRNCRQGISKGMQEGREAGRANGDRTRQGVAGTAVLVKLQAAATEHMWGPEEAKQGGESAAKHKAPCASSSKGLWSNR